MELYNLKDPKQREMAVSYVKDVADVVCSTMGPAGSTVIVQVPDRTPAATKDGVSVVQSLTGFTGLKKTVSDIMLDAANQTVRIVGDGTTTTIALIDAICEEFIKVYGDKIPNPREVENDFNTILNCVIAEIDKLKVVAEDYKTISDVATISANNNRTMGNAVAELAMKVGKDSTISFSETPTQTEITYEYKEGYVFDGGIPLTQFINMRRLQGREMGKSLVLLSNDALVERQQALDVLNWYNSRKDKNEYGLIIIASEIDKAFVETVILNLPGNGNANLNVCCITHSFMHQRRKMIYEDLQMITGAKGIIDRSAGLHLDDKLDFDSIIGYVDGCEALNKQTVFTPVEGYKEKKQDNQSFEEYIEDVKAYIASGIIADELEFARMRLSRLTSGVGKILVGGDTDIARFRDYKQVEDCVLATFAAMRTGVVEGGGMALIRAAETTHALKGPNFDIIRKACKAPYHRIMANANKLTNCENCEIKSLLKHQGVVYDLITNKQVNALEAGIIDPVTAPKTALQKAISAAIQILLSHSVIRYT